MTRIAKLCLAHMMAIQIASKQSYFNTTWVKDYSHYVPPHNARNNRKTKKRGKR
jgi:hypothetical protein